MTKVSKVLLFAVLLVVIFLFIFGSLLAPHSFNVYHISKWQTGQVETMTRKHASLEQDWNAPTSSRHKPPDSRSPNPHMTQLPVQKQGRVSKPSQAKSRPWTLQNKPHHRSRQFARPQNQGEDQGTTTRTSPSASLDVNVMRGTLNAVQNGHVRGLWSVLEALFHQKPSLLNADAPESKVDESRSESNIHSIIRTDNRTFFPVSDQETFNFTSMRQKDRGKGLYSDSFEYPLPRVYWDTQQRRLIHYFRSYGMQATEGLGVRHTTRVTEIERRYLAKPPLTDLAFYPEETKSKAYLLSKNKIYQVGDLVSIRVDLYDQRGRSRTRGGDDVRIWLNNSLGFSASARVTDLGNGSYVGETILRWSGKAKVLVSLTYPGEFLRLVVELRQAVLSTRYITARFNDSRGQVTEMTPCLPTSPIPGYASTCNLTRENGMSPFFCGQPTKAKLSCSHLYKHDVLPFLRPLFLPSPNPSLGRLMNRKDNLRLVPNTITIRTREGVTPSPLPPCWTVPRRRTWDLGWHQGWLERGTWHPDGCALPPALSPDLLERCLANTTLLLLGDSNAREMYRTVTTGLGTPPPEHAWHKPMVQEISWLNCSIAFIPHARPFNPGHAHELRTLSTEQLFPALPPGRSYVIVLHFWLHLTFYPLSYLRDRLRQATRAIHTLLQRHPTARVLLRGPHVLYKNAGHREQLGDYQGPWVRQMAREEFRELRDKVWFLDFWPLTVASENQGIHPPPPIVEQMVRVALGLACQTHTEAGSS